MKALRPLAVGAGIVLAWEALVAVFGTPAYIVAPPSAVATAAAADPGLLAWHALHTAAEIALGLALGVALGLAAALLLAWSSAARAWALPLMVVSQAIPVFAIAPLLVLWLGYGMASKVAMATLIIFFPVASATWDGLRRTEPGWLELARTMDASPRAVLLQIRLPAALPAFASGVRVAASVAPIGAVVGEWVGASAGLGYLMMQQLARGQTPLAFAALAVLCLIGLALYYATDAALRRLLPWVAEARPEP